MSTWQSWQWVLAVTLTAFVLIALCGFASDYRNAPPLPGGYRRFKLLWEPRDLWLGFYRDPANRRTYICFLPCVVVLVERYNAPDLEREAKR